MNALTATVSRRKMRPIPGEPSGKLEKSLCSRYLLRHKDAPEKRLASFAANWTPRTSAFSVPPGNSRALGGVGKARDV
jgi:uncharacterized protein YukJ